MAKRTIIFLALGAALAAANPLLAKPLSYMLPDDTSAFRPGHGVEAVQKNCAACHSADYISIQPPNKGSVFWDAEVQKMIKVYHAPIDQNDVKSISEYLAKTY